MVSRCFFFIFAYVSELGMRETVTTRLRERQIASERVVEAQSGLREWSVRESDRESTEVLRERRESFSEIQKWEAEMKS